MIYSPAHYTEKRTDLIYQFITEYNFATVISQTETGLQISHLPLLVEAIREENYLVGHCAKANPHWKQFEIGTPVTAIFHGPHAYVSPAWYQPKADNVPTWNYAAVHVSGVSSIEPETLATFHLLQKITDHFEKKYQTGWALPDVPNNELTKLLEQIVAFKIKITDIQAKFKLSQKQESKNRSSVIHNLDKMGHDQKSVAELMNLILKSES